MIPKKRDLSKEELDLLTEWIWNLVKENKD